MKLSKIGDDWLRQTRMMKSIKKKLSLSAAQEAHAQNRPDLVSRIENANDDITRAEEVELQQLH